MRPGHPQPVEHAIPGAFNECARALAIGRYPIAELVVHHWLTGEATIFQTDITVIPPSQEKFTGSASACGAYTYKAAVRWPRGLRRRFAKAAEDQRTGRNLYGFGPFFIGNLVGVGCRMVAIGPRLGTVSGTGADVSNYGVTGVTEEIGRGGWTGR